MEWISSRGSATAAVHTRHSDTVDYVHLHSIIREEMGIRSKLLESVAARILDRIFVEVPAVASGEIAISKINPPLGGDVERVTVILSKER